MKEATELRILIFSLDPVLLGRGSGDVLQRHIDYAARVKSLDIIVLGGVTAESKKITEKLTIHSTGGQGLAKAFKAYAIGRHICTQGIDLIDTQDPHMTGLVGWLLKRKFHLPLEVHCHGDFIANPYWRSESRKNIWYEKLQRFVFKRADGIRVVSPLIADKITKYQLTTAKVITINTPVNTELFMAQLTKPDPNYFTIVSNMRLVAAKNILFTLDCLKKLGQKYTDIRYRIIGIGPLRSALEQRVKELQLEQVVTFLGAMPPEQVVSVYAQADLQLLLSTNESFGKVIIEAGLMAVPTLASDTLGARTIIESEKTGLLVPINDATATVAALERLYQDREGCRHLGQAARTVYGQKYQRQQTVDKIIAFWQELTNAYHG